jgi:DNA-binding winged helix-turn-helix (wHTH) protein/class 3 adenylate cyclase
MGSGADRTGRWPDSAGRDANFWPGGNTPLARPAPGTGHTPPDVEPPTTPAPAQSHLLRLHGRKRLSTDMNSSQEKQNTERYKFGPFVLDAGGTLQRETEPGRYELVNLQPQSLKILTFLVRHAAELVTRDRLMNVVFGHDVNESHVNTLICEIRERLGDQAGSPTYIKTLPKRGYIFIKEVTRLDDLPPLPQPRPSQRGFNELNSLHVHIDGGDEGALVEGMVGKLEREGRRSKINRVLAFTKGPQRESDPEDYIAHTPGGLKSENLQYFSTHLFGNFAETKVTLRRLLADLHEATGARVVVEVERVIGRIEHDGADEWSDTYVHHFPALCSGDVGFKVSKTKPIEIHYAIDIPKKSPWLDRHPLELATLPSLTAELGIRVGGWFLFDKRGQNKWAYRSNMFAADIRQEEVRAHWLQIKAAVEALGRSADFTCEVRAVVEHSIGIWNTPLEGCDGRRSVEELSDWEAKYPNLREFWVVTPNFLGDKEEHIQGAMIRNLRRGVVYTYFLQSIADYNRLLSLAEDLRGKLRADVKVYEQIRAVLVLRDASGERPLERQFRQEGVQGCFIANPIPAAGGGGDDADGYMLEKSDDPGQISGGRVMTRGQLAEIVGLLKPLVPDGRPLQGYSMPLAQQEKVEVMGATVVCVGLEGLPDLLNEVDDAGRARQLRDYDLLVAGETSKFGGQVVRSIEPGYLLLFKNPNEAWLCARTLLRAAAPPCALSVAIDLGGVWRIMRAHGDDYCGKTVARCRELLKATAAGELLVTGSFHDELGKRYQPELELAQKELVSEAGRSEIWKLKT